MIWVLIPTKFPSKYLKVFFKWREQGYYHIAVHANNCDPYDLKNNYDALFTNEWQGMPKSYNMMTRYLLERFPETKIFVFAADDIEPDPRHSAEKIEAIFLERFPDTFGIMQPRLNGHNLGSAESAWVGRKFVEVGFKGACNENYWHWYWDTELELIAKILKVYWENFDL